jgi:hypothetical protein
MKNMKKIVKLTEQDLVRIIKKVIQEQPDSKFDTPYNKAFVSNSAKNKPTTNKPTTNKPTNFNATAVVEDDMYMEFPVVKFTVSGSNVKMFFNDDSYSSGTKFLYVNNFGGPIYDTSTNKVIYRDSNFQNINNGNYKQISKSQNIPM